ncbi:MAG TPA: AgmX/PglI C-terminal domain-containing protein [Polyangiaceae bacterium]|jgi:hypothetical protein
MQRHLGAVIVGAGFLFTSACGKPLAVSPTHARAPGLSVCWRDVDDSDLGLERPVRVAIGKRLEAAGYTLVKHGCDLAVGWSFTTRGHGSDTAFWGLRMTVRRGDGTLVDHGERTFGPSDLPADDPDRLAMVVVNALNASPKVAAVTHSEPRPVNGRLAPSVIQHVVRSHFGEMKSCYEAGLAKDPSVGGRTRTRFVIDRTGHVSSAEDVESDSTLPSEVRECVTKQFSALEFPPPVGGIVTVVYPLIFTPGSGETTPEGDAGAPSADGAFNRDAAAVALDEAARDLGACATPGGPRGGGHIQVTFEPSGQVTMVTIDAGPFGRTPTGGCISSRFSRARIPRFSGGDVTVGKSFELK